LIYSNNWHHALRLYEQAEEFVLALGVFDYADIMRKAEYGIAKNALRCGHIERGLKIISELCSPELGLACAEILENSKVSQLLKIPVFQHLCIPTSLSLADLLYANCSFTTRLLACTKMPNNMIKQHHST